MTKDDWRASTRMSLADWLTSTDPRRMIDWLEAQGYGPLLWDFAIACCRRIWEELPGDPFRRVVEHVEEVGIRDVEDSLHEASESLDKLERRLRKATSSSEESRLNRQIGYANMVLAAFDQQDGASAARSISGDLSAWAEDGTAEAQLQAASLRDLVPDPSQRNEG
jgi:hypothetical protein